MSIAKTGRVSGPPAPNIHLGSRCGSLASVCLTAPDKAGTLAEQTQQILDSIDAHLRQLGSSRKSLVMVQVWMADIAELTDFAEVWNRWIDRDNVPGLSVVQAAASRRDSLIEIRAYAAPGGFG